MLKEIFNKLFNNNTKPTKPKGINFDYLIPFISEEYKNLICNSKDPNTLKQIFNISDKACEAFYHKIRRAKASNKTE